MAFAKLYGDDDGQVLVKLGASDTGPEIRFYFQPPDLGVCSVAVGFKDTDEGWDKAEAVFAATTEEGARKVVEKQMARLADMMAPNAAVSRPREGATEQAPADPRSA